MFSRITVIFLAFVMFFVFNCGSDDAYRQEMVRVVYANPKYVKDVSIFTFRPNRTSPYLTNANATLLQNWGNNLTIVLEAMNIKFGAAAFQLEFKHCDILKLPWAKDWLKSFTDIPATCPTMAGCYHFKEIELPPKNFPIPVTNSDYHVKFMYYMTNTKEKIAEITGNLKFQKKNRKH